MNVIGAVRPSVACRGERRACTFRCLSGLPPSAEPPPTGNRSSLSRTTPTPQLLWATTALSISAANQDARARLELSTLFGARLSPLSASLSEVARLRDASTRSFALSCEQREDRRAVPSVGLLRAPLAGSVGPFRSRWAMTLLAIAGRREELRVLRREQHGRALTERRRCEAALPFQGPAPPRAGAQHPSVIGPGETRVGDSGSYPKIRPRSRCVSPPREGRRTTRDQGAWDAS